MNLVDLTLYPGDTVTAIRPTDPTITDGVICILQASHVSNMVAKPAERLVWLQKSTNTNGSVRLKPVATTNVIGMATILDADKKMDDL